MKPITSENITGQDQGDRYMAKSANPNRLEQATAGTGAAHKDAAKRPIRSRLDTRDKLKVPHIPGYRGRFVNIGDGARIEQLKEWGYDPAIGKPKTHGNIAGEASQMGSAVELPVGGGQKALLMYIPEEFYQAAQKEKEQSRAELEGDMLIQDAKQDGRQVDGAQQYGKVVKGEES